MSDAERILSKEIGRVPIPLSKIDAIVSEQLGPARVRGNAQPNVLYRHIAMYLGKHVGGWSTTRIGRFYNGRDHSTVCYAIRRIESLRKRDARVERMIIRLSELCREDRAEQPHPSVSESIKTTRDLPEDALLDNLADRIADRIISRLWVGASPPSSPARQRRADDEN
jgi:hypothetical protein